MNNAPTLQKIEITRIVDKVTNICNMRKLFRNVDNKSRFTDIIEELSNE
jgi:hypothetical protein